MNILVRVSVHLMIYNWVISYVFSIMKISCEHSYTCLANDFSILDFTVVLPCLLQPSPRLYMTYTLGLITVEAVSLWNLTSSFMGTYEQSGLSPSRLLYLAHVHSHRSPFGGLLGCFSHFQSIYSEHLSWAYLGNPIVATI